MSVLTLMSEDIRTARVKSNGVPILGIGEAAIQNAPFASVRFVLRAAKTRGLTAGQLAHSAQVARASVYRSSSRTRGGDFSFVVFRRLLRTLNAVQPLTEAERQEVIGILLAAGH